jgi:hypothetical protein
VPRSGAGCHVGGQDVVRVSVEVLAGPVVAHRGPRVSVPGLDLDIPQVHARIQHGRDERSARLDLREQLDVGRRYWFGTRGQARLDRAI